MGLELDFKGKVAFVTGAASGIGRATALEFAKAGARVAVSDVDDGGGVETVKQIEKVGGEALYIHCDVSSEDQVKSAIATTVKTFGRLDCAFNNAGFEGKTASTADCETAIFDKVIAINLKGVWLCMKYEIQQMLKQGGGSIVNCSSILGLTGLAAAPAYAASKHGVLGLTKVAALENARTGIRINAVCPGFIETPMLDRATGGNKSALAGFANLEPIGRMGRPEEIAWSVLYLSSEKAGFVTGYPLAVDGGFMAQ